VLDGVAATENIILVVDLISCTYCLATVTTYFMEQKVQSIQGTYDWFMPFLSCQS